MKHPLVVCLFLILAIIVVPSAQAVEVAVAEKKIKVNGPKGFCQLDIKHPMDSQVIAATQQAIQSHNEELAMFVDCQRLKDWRNGKTDDLGDTADYQVPLKMKTQSFASNEIISATCDVFRKQGAAIIKDTGEQIANNFNSIEAFAGKIQLNNQKMYGVLHEDKSGCYAGVVQKLQIKNKAQTIFIILAITVVKGKIIYVYHSSGLKSGETITRLLKTSRETVAATLAQN